MSEITKERILQEIRRISESNGGSPPGKQKFFQETGIKESYWSGKFWTKWSHALAEAGYLPNQLQKPIPEIEVLENYARLTAELGHIPTTAEMKMKAREDSSFLSHNTLNHLGPKRQRLSKLLEFCRKTPIYKDLVLVVEEAIRAELISKKPRERVVEKSIVSEEGYVYLLQFGDTYKIGSSKNVERRFRELKTQMPYDGKIIHSIATGDLGGIELYWHNYFKEKRLRGEWFKLSDSDVRYFKKRKLM